MAKLSAYGRTELVRLTKEVKLPQPNNQGIEKERYTVAFMSDGKLLKKIQTWWLPSEYDLKYGHKGQYHDYGWKVMGKAKEGVTVEQFKTHFESRGYHV